MRKRILIPAGILVLLGIAIGLFALLLGPQPANVPQPWGAVQFVQLSTNGSKRQATFSFTSYFGWPVVNETATETKTNGTWPDRFFVREPDYSALPASLSTGMSCTFTVDVPESTDAWRVLVRSTKQRITAAERRRQRMRGWFMMNGMSIVADRISVEGSSHYVTPGPEMTR